MLLDIVVARQPGEERPVADLPFHVVPLRLAFLDPGSTGVVRAVDRHDVAYGAFVDPLDGFTFGLVITPAKPRHDGQSFSFRLLGGGQHPANAWRVDRHGFFGEYV